MNGESGGILIFLMRRLSALAMPPP